MGAEYVVHGLYITHNYCVITTDITYEIILCFVY